MARARRLMQRKGVTLRDLVIAGLRRSLDQAGDDATFCLRDARWKGKQGFAPGTTFEDLPRLTREMNEEWRRS